MQKFIINEKLLEALDEYDKRSLLMQQHGSLGLPYEGDLYEDVNDDLIYHVPQNDRHLANWHRVYVQRQRSFHP